MTGIATQYTSPLSFNQAYFLFMGWWRRMVGRYSPPASATQIRLALHGPLQTDVLETAFVEVIRRHHVLRTAVDATRHEDLKVSPATRRRIDLFLRTNTDLTRLVQEGWLGPESELLGVGVFTQRRDDALSIAVSETSVQHLAPSEQVARIDSLALRQLNTPFDYRTTPTIRASLVRKTAREHVLLLSTDYLSCDGKSLDIFLNELFRVYQSSLELCRRGDEQRQPQYCDYAAWERCRLRGSRLGALLDHWRQQWLLVPTASRLPETTLLDWNVSATTATESLDEEMTEAIHAFCTKHRFTPYTVFVSALAIVLLSRHEMHAIPILATVPNRIAADTQKMVGRFSNTHVMVFQCDRNATVQDFLRHAAAKVAQVHFNQELPSFAASVWNRQGMTPVDTLFRMRHALEQRNFGDLTITQVLSSNRLARVGLDLQVILRQGITELIADAHPGYYTARSLVTLLGQIRHLLERIARGNPRDMRLSNLW